MPDADLFWPSVRGKSDPNNGVTRMGRRVCGSALVLYLGAHAIKGDETA